MLFKLAPIRYGTFCRQSNLVSPLLRNFWAKSESGTHDDFKPKSKQSFDSDATNEYISKVINENDVVLFMKGNPKMPQCGFSNYVVQIFKFYGLSRYFHVNVLESNEVREGIKKFSNWPTIPQLYVRTEFIGGCDIVKEMHMDGSLEELLLREKLIKK